jgi:hypothetical protein
MAMLFLGLEILMIFLLFSRINNMEWMLSFVPHIYRNDLLRASGTHGDLRWDINLCQSASGSPKGRTA